MGYSILTPFDNEQEKVKMYEFLQKYYQPMDRLLQTVNKKIVEVDESFPLTDDVSYGKDVEPFILGFDYGASTTQEEKGYYYALCYFIAVVSGKKKDFNNHQKRPYIIYDGMDEWALFVNEERDKTIESVSVNEFGYRELPELGLYKKGIVGYFDKINPFVKYLTKVDTIIHDELKRLHELWQKENK